MYPTVHNSQQTKSIMRLSIDPFPSEKKDQMELIYQWLVNYPDLYTSIALKRDKNISVNELTIIFPRYTQQCVKLSMNLILTITISPKAQNLTMKIAQIVMKPMR